MAARNNKILINYDNRVSRVVGKSAEELELPPNGTFSDVLNFLLTAYPQIEDEIPPGVLGMTVDGVAPDIFSPMKDGALVEFTVPERAKQARFDVKGKTPFISITEDINSPEAKAVIEYIRWHDRLTTDVKSLSEDHVRRIGQQLLTEDLSTDLWKDGLMVLAHHPSAAALELLHALSRSPLEDWQRTWVKQAVDECKTFNKQRLTGRMSDPVISTIGIPRNKTCPCGSGKKFKFCCGRLM